MITTEYLFQLVPLIMVVFYLNVVLKLMTSENVLLNDFLLNDNSTLIDEYGSIDFMNTVRGLVIKSVLR